MRWVVQELGIQNELFFATKISTRGGRAAGIQQQESSMRAWGRHIIDLNQVHNLRGVEIHLPTIREAKEEGRTRYVGVTTSFARQFERMEQVMRSEPLDFVQLNYSIVERQAAERLLPLAQVITPNIPEAEVLDLRDGVLDKFLYGNAQYVLFERDIRRA